MIEIELYRDLAERRAVGRTVAEVEAPDTWMARTTSPAALAEALIGGTLVAARRRGKLLMLDVAASARRDSSAQAGEGRSGSAGEVSPLGVTDRAGSAEAPESGSWSAGGASPLRGTGGAASLEGRDSSASAGSGGGSEAVAVLGLRFGMTGRLIVDREAGVDALLYSARGDDPRWDRFTLRFTDGGSLIVSDPRRLGAIELDPNEDALGPDALTLTPARLRAALGTSGAPLEARLMDQSRVAGVGNLIADEVLWRAALNPERTAGSLSDAEVRRLSHHLRQGIAELTRRGGSHTGDLMPARVRDGRCPRDGRVLRRTQVGGRTTYWCPHHQR